MRTAQGEVPGEAVFVRRKVGIADLAFQLSGLAVIAVKIGLRGATGRAGCRPRCARPPAAPAHRPRRATHPRRAGLPAGRGRDAPLRRGGRGGTHPGHCHAVPLPPAHGDEGLDRRRRGGRSLPRTRLRPPTHRAPRGGSCPLRRAERQPHLAARTPRRQRALRRLRLCPPRDERLPQGPDALRGGHRGRMKRRAARTGRKRGLAAALRG